MAALDSKVWWDMAAAQLLGRQSTAPAQNPPESVYLLQTKHVKTAGDPNHKPTPMDDISHIAAFVLVIYWNCPWRLAHKEVYKQL